MLNDKGNEITYYGDQICNMMTTSDPDVKQIVCDLVDQHISCCLPITPPGEQHEVTGYTVDVIHRLDDNHPSILRRSNRKHLSPEDALLEKNINLDRLVCSVQHHAINHTPSCFKGGLSYCHFNFAKCIHSTTKFALVKG